MNEIFGYNKKNITVQQSLKGNSKIAIFYPGLGYSLSAPCFFYLLELFRSNGYDTYGIDYRYNENIEFMNATEELQDTWFDYDSRVIGENLKNETSHYAETVYIGKSLGTTMLMKQLNANLISADSLIIWLTPGVYVHDIFSTIIESVNRSMVVCGTADKYYKVEEINRIKGRKNVNLKEIQKAGHAFEVINDIEKSILNIVEVVEAVREFISTELKNEI